MFKEVIIKMNEDTDNPDNVLIIDPSNDSLKRTAEKVKITSEIMTIYRKLIVNPNVDAVSEIGLKHIENPPTIIELADRQISSLLISNKLVITLSRRNDFIRIRTTQLKEKYMQEMISIKLNNDSIISFGDFLDIATMTYEVKTRTDSYKNKFKYIEIVNEDKLALGITFYQNNYSDLFTVGGIQLSYRNR